MLGLLAAAAAPADDAIYSVDWMNTNPPQVLVKIDTHPWDSDIVARTARVSVTFATSEGDRITRKYDFLNGATHPSYLEQGHIYGRTFAVDVTGATGIQDSGVMFPNDEGKADVNVRTAGARHGITAAPTDRIEGAGGAPAVNHGTNYVVAQPAALAHMQWYSQTDYQGSDFASMGTRSVQECSDRCVNKAQCRAFTWVNGEGGGMCWLKNTVPSGSKCGNCISGIKSP
jgi:PAN domain-containing protein